MRAIEEVACICLRRRSEHGRLVVVFFPHPVVGEVRVSVPMPVAASVLAVVDEPLAVGVYFLALFAGVFLADAGATLVPVAGG